MFNQRIGPERTGAIGFNPVAIVLDRVELYARRALVHIHCPVVGAAIAPVADHTVMQMHTVVLIDLDVTPKLPAAGVLATPSS